MDVQENLFGSIYFIEINIHMINSHYINFSRAQLQYKILS